MKKRQILESDETNKHARYEESAKRTQVLSIRTSKTDNVDEWDAIIDWLKELGKGKAKDGLHKLAKKNKII